MRVRQVLGNYLNNALKFTAQGAVSLHAAAGAGQRLRFEVRDSGPGIAADVQARLFQPFTQADQSTTRRFGGSGLGLSICLRTGHADGRHGGRRQRARPGQLLLGGTAAAGHRGAGRTNRASASSNRRRWPAHAC